MVINKEDIAALKACVEVAEPSDDDTYSAAIHVRAHATMLILEREGKKSPEGSVIIVPTLS